MAHNELCTVVRERSSADGAAVAKSLRDGPPLRSPARRRAVAKTLRHGAAGWLYLLPAFLVYALIVLVPLGQSVWFSLFDWNGITTARWVGLNNYLDFFSDPRIGRALSHTLILITFFSLIPITLGLIAASLISRAKTRGSGFFRSLIFLPQVLTTVVIAITWKQIYSPNGALNEALSALGLESVARTWLADFTWALPALGIVGTWTTMGLCMLLFLAGMGNISTDLYDAVRVDGAGPVREFFAVTLPGVVPQLAVALTLTIVGALRAFDLIWLTTRGGPGTSTVTPAILLYSEAFTQQNVGSGAAIGVCLAILALLISLIIVRLSDRNAS